MNSITGVFIRKFAEALPHHRQSKIARMILLWKVWRADISRRCSKWLKQFQQRSSPEEKRNESNVEEKVADTVSAHRMPAVDQCSVYKNSEVVQRVNSSYAVPVLSTTYSVKCDLSVTVYIINGVLPTRTIKSHSKIPYTRILPSKLFQYNSSSQIYLQSLFSSSDLKFLW